MIDLSFLTDAEQEAILKVLQRDADLKKAEEQRVRHLQDEVDDENELKYKTGQWFYEAKSKRHRDKIHGADLVRASIRKRKSPTTLAELSQSGKDKSKRRWVNSINQDLFIPPELYGVMESPDEREEDLMPSMAESNQSAKRLNVTSKDTDKGVMKNGTASPAKQRKNPFNSEGSVIELDLNNGMPDQSLRGGQVNGQDGKKNDLMSSIKKYGVKLPYPSPVGGRRSSQEAKEDPLPKQPPVPKPRKLVNGQPPDRSNSSLQREDSFNTNKRKGILKRRSSSSSTDSESIRIPQTAEPIKLVLPTSPILEAEQTHLFDDHVSSSENSPDRQKQVRFSENVHQKPPTPNPESYNALEIDEFGILEPGSYQNELDYEFGDHKESKLNRYLDIDYDNSPPNSSLILDTEKKREHQSKGIHNGVHEILDESSPELNIDSAGTEPLYAVVKKPSTPTSSDQDKDLDVDDALMEPTFLGQRGTIENHYQNENLLEFGKSHGGVGKINYVSDYPTNQPGKVSISTNEDIMTPERATDVQSSYYFVDEPKTRTQDIDCTKWKRPSTLENKDLSSQPRAVQEFPGLIFGEGADASVKPYSENGTRSRYSPKEYKTDTKYKSVVLRNTPEVDGRLEAPSSNFPVAQNLPSSSRPVSGDYQTHEMFLRENREKRDLPKSAHFKVMSMKERIHDMPSEQMSNPAQFQSLKHFWNVEDKNQSKGDLDTSPQRILTDVLKRNKPTRADLKDRNSKEIPAEDLSLPSSFDSLSEEEQTSHKVASWLARSPTVYGTDQVDANEDQVQPGEEVMESIDKTTVDRKSQAEEFSSALQKLTEEASQVPKITNPEYVKSQPIQMSPVVQPALLEKKKTSPAILMNSAEKKPPATGFYERVVQKSNTPVKQSKIVVDVPAVSTKQYAKEVEESVERTEAPERTSNEFKIGFQKLMEEYQYSKSDDENQEEESNLPSEKQQLTEEQEIIEKSSVPKGNDHQDFISALKKLEIEASTPLNVADQDQQLESVSPPNSVSPVESANFQKPMKQYKSASNESDDENKVEESTQPSEKQQPIETQEIIEKSSVPKGNDQQEFILALKKLEIEASTPLNVANQDEQLERVLPPNLVSPVESAKFQKPMKQYKSASTESDDLDEVDESTLPIETQEIIEKSSVPKGNDQQEFISALKKLEIEASTPLNVEDREEQPEIVSPSKTASPVKSAYKIGFEHMTPTEVDALESPQNVGVSYTIQSSPPYREDKNEIEEVVEKTTAHSRKDESDLSAALKKLENEAAVPSVELEETYEKPKMTPTLQSTMRISTIQKSPSFDVQTMPSPSYYVEDKPYLEDPYSKTTKKSKEEAEDTFVIPEREKPIYTFEGVGKLPVEEETIGKTIVDTEESNADYRKRLLQLEEEATTSIPEEPEDLSVSQKFYVSQAPMKEVFISKRVFPSSESMPTEMPSRGIPKDLSRPQPYAYQELANYPQSPSDQSGSFPGSAGNVLYKKPDTPSELSNSKKGMDESHPVLSALRRSADKKLLYAQAVEEVSPTSTNQSKLNSQKEETLENSFPENAEKFKRMSQSVPTFLQDDTDGRETDSASESSFQIGRHKKSPSSLTNLSGSSGMASMSSVSGSVMSMYSGDFGNLDIKGAIEFSIEYAEQLKEFHIYVYQCKDLAAAEVKKQRSDPYVKAYLLPEKAKMGKRKSAVKKKTLNPVYNEVLRYKISKESLQAQTLNLSVWHHDALGRNSFLGEVNLNLATWDWSNTQRSWYQLEARTPASGIGLENRGEMKLSLMYIPVSPTEVSKKPSKSGEVHIMIKECIQLPMLRENKINSFVKCTILPDTSRKSRQKTRTVDKTPNPIFSHTMVYDGFKEEDLREACVELTVWDHNKLSNHFLGGLRIGLGSGKSYGTAVDWMDSSPEESTMWEKMMASPNTWIDGMLPLRMFKMAKLNK